MTRPSIPEPPHTGGCLCGAVRYSYNARPLTVSACHCVDCKKLSGGTNLIGVVALTDAFTHTGETQVYRKKADSGRDIDVHRCAVCGTRMWHAPLAAPNVVLFTAGTLDDWSWAVPAAHIWIDKVSPEVLLHDDAWHAEGQPADRTAAIERFKTLYPE